ncbi:ATPase [Aureococcus anophagefferens]|nr:ATPase [Aureococcus anophagefferens]
MLTFGPRTTASRDVRRGIDADGGGALPDPEYGTFRGCGGADPPGAAPESPQGLTDPTSPAASVRAMKKKHGYERQKRASFAGLTTKSSKLLRTAPVEHKENAPPRCSGAVDRGNFVAVLGPSGSGKTSLIDLLSSRKTTGYFTGVLRLDGLPFTQSRVRHSSAYIPTIQAFPALLTVLETLTFVARLRCPRAQEYVGGTLASGQVVKGLSDGQKRRLAIARGVISRPSVVFADEPTRGLDAGATLSVMKLLGDLARTANIGVLCTIHQPHQTIWKMFDRVYFLSAGYVMYDGPAADAVPWFGGLGYFGEQQLGSASPSEVCIDLMSIDFFKPAPLRREHDARHHGRRARPWQFTKTKLEFYDDVLMRCNMAAKDEETLQLIIFDAASFSTEIRELFVRAQAWRRDPTGQLLRFADAQR